MGTKRLIIVAFMVVATLFGSVCAEEEQEKGQEPKQDQQAPAEPKQDQPTSAKPKPVQQEQPPVKTKPAQPIPAKPKPAQPKPVQKTPVKLKPIKLTPAKPKQGPQTPVPPKPGQRTAVKSKRGFGKVDKYISESRKGIEDRYERLLKKARSRADSDIKEFEDDERAALANTKSMKEKWLTDIYGFVPDGKALSDEEVESVEKRITEKKKEIKERLKVAIATLEREKKYLLDISLAGLEKQLKKDARKPKAAPTHGVIKGIVYGKKKQSVMIDEKIVNQGETIHGVKVVKIYRDSVEFEKDGKVWKQKVREKAKEFWK